MSQQHHWRTTSAHVSGEVVLERFGWHRSSAHVIGSQVLLSSSHAGTTQIMLNVLVDSRKPDNDYYSARDPVVRALKPVFFGLSVAHDLQRRSHQSSSRQAAALAGML
jgi:hypothetical protein